jgi:hypothetical protein
MMRIFRWTVLVTALLIFGLSIVIFGQAQAPAPAGGAPAAGAAPQGGGGGGRQGGGGGGGRQGGGGGGGRQGGGGGGNRGGNADATPPQPAPRWANGKIRLSSVPGQVGLWFGDFGGGTTQGEIQYQPWARAVLDYRRVNEFEPHARCKPSGVVREFQTPYGVDILDNPDSNVIYIFDVGGPHTFRTIFMDGRPHPADFTPNAYGHSVGKWEGDTLVVDTVGFNEKFWLDRAGTPHTDKMRVTEKFTRTNMTAMRYEYTVDDPATYTAPWSRVANIAFRTNQELFEYVCQDNNLGSELMVGGGESVDRSSRIVP